MAKVSVIIPVYNTAKYLKYCLDSVLNQSLDDIEVICVDDNSADESIKILKEYQEKDSRVIVVFNDNNIGAANSRNKGLEIAKGEYIQFLDSDDWLDRDALKDLYNEAKKNSADLCYLKFAIENECNQSNVQEGIMGEYKGVFSGYDCFGLFREKSEFFLYLCSVFYSNTFIRKNGLMFKNMVVGEGGQFIISALHKADRVVFMSRPIYHYRLHTKSVMHDRSAKCNLVRGWISQYTTLLDCVSQCDDGGNEYILLAKKIYNDISINIKVMSGNELNIIYGMLDRNIERYYFDMIRGVENEYAIKISSDNFHRICNSDNVILYGAGIYTFDVLRQLQENDIEIIGIAVTNRNSQKKSYYGHHVFEIGELIKYRYKSIVIVTASSKYYKEIEQTLTEYGFVNYILLEAT